MSSASVYTYREQKLGALDWIRLRKPLAKAEILLRGLQPPYIFPVMKLWSGKSRKMAILMCDAAVPTSLLPWIVHQVCTCVAI